MGKKGYALVEAVTAVALVMMASGILSLGISFGLRMERRAEQLKNTETVWEVPARFRMRMRGKTRLEKVQIADSVFSDQRETE